MQRVHTHCDKGCVRIKQMIRSGDDNKVVGVISRNIPCMLMNDATVM